MQLILRTSTLNTTLKAGRKIEYIVVHYTAGVTSKSGSAINTIDYYKTTKNVSADYTVDDTTVVQYNPDIKNRYCWHCGGSFYNNKGGKYYKKCSNQNSIGIEICSSNTTGKMQDPNSPTYYFTPAVLNNTTELIKQLILEYNISPENIIRHYDVTGKLCPGINGWNAEKYSDGECEWQKFKSRFVNVKPVLYTIQIGAFSVKENAEKYLKEVQKNYPNAFIKIKE